MSDNTTVTQPVVIQQSAYDRQLGKEKEQAELFAHIEKVVRKAVRDEMKAVRDKMEAVKKTPKTEE
jgi:hypothetical protein